MRIPSTRRLLGGATAALFFTLAAQTSVFAYSSYMNTWNNLYPNSLSGSNVISGTGSSCQLCHRSSNGGNNYNSYGFKIRELKNTMSTSAAIAAAGSFDSDGDPTGSTNLVEIMSDTQPGWTDGPNNTTYSGSNPQTGQLPPANILGQLDPCSGSATTYCTASTTSIGGCQALLSSSGTPSVSNPSQFLISSSAVPGGNLGIMYFGDQGPAAIPFGTMGGFVCAKPGFRTGPKPSGGSSGSCTGSYNFSLTDLVTAGPSLIVAGNTINAGMWFRDPANPDGFALSNGIEFAICP